MLDNLQPFPMQEAFLFTTDNKLKAGLRDHAARLLPPAPARGHSRGIPAVSSSEPRPARWVGLGERLRQIGHQPTGAQPALTSRRAGPPESLALQPHRGEEGSEARPQASQLPPQ